MKTLRHLVVGTDFSEPAEQALELAIRLALAAGARITLVHVCEPCVDDRLDERRRRQSHARLAQVVARHRQRVEIAGVLRSGRAWEKLDNVAAEVGASLIVVGRHGADLGRSVALGSVADRVVHTANRHVLTVATDFDRLESEAPPTNPNNAREEEDHTP
jgi:nucleotide-binding universal stress UspA family protein